MDNIFGSRVFFPQWGTFRVLQKSHYGLRGEKTRTLVRKWERWQTQKLTLLCLDIQAHQVPGMGPQLALA